MFQGFISKFTKKSLVKAAAAACIAASMVFGASAQIGESEVSWELVDGVLTISGTGDMPTDFTWNGTNNPWYDQRTSITSVVIGNDVTSIGNFAFNGCTELTEVTFGNSITSIGNNAFVDCVKLTEITIPNGVKSIGNQSFDYCMGLTSVTIPNSVTSIGNRAFGVCMQLTEIIIPNSVESIGNQAFYNCSELTEITIPNSVESIGVGAFLSCGKLTEINVGESNANFASADGVLFNKNKSTLIECPGGKTGAYVIPNSVTSVGEGAFQSCVKLTAITIPNLVESIGNYAFQNCTGLTSVVIPNSVTSVGEGAFSLCSGLTSVVIPNSVKSIENSAFFRCSKLTAITIPNLVTTIKNSAFSGCKGLTSVVIPNSVTYVGDNAFKECSELTAVTIGSSASIDYSVFEKCTKLKQVVNLKEIPQSIGANVFQDVSIENVKLFVPKIAVDAYKAANIWKGFNIVMSIETPKPTPIANLVYTGEEKTGTTEDVRYIVSNGKATNAGEHEARIALLDGLKWEGDETTSEITLKWTIAKGNPAYTAPTGLTAKVGQKLENVTLSGGWSWMNPAELVGGIGEQTHKAKFTPTDVANYNVLTDIDVKVTVSAAVPIREIQKSDGRTGIRLSKNVVSDKAEFEVILPSDKVLEVKAAIYDNTGNVVFEKIERGANVSWNLTNNAGRNVANGSYLIIVEAKGVNGNYAYSAKVGVKK